MQNDKLMRNSSLQKKESIQRADAPIKEVILHATAKIMNEKGFAKSSISEIAKEAGVKDPVIYQYFKGKEDLLFSIVQTHMEKGFEFLFSGTCRKCNRELTNPESIREGIGPICAGRS